MGIKFATLATDYAYKWKGWSWGWKVFPVKFSLLNIAEIVKFYDNNSVSDIPKLINNFRFPNKIELARAFNPFCYVS